MNPTVLVFSFFEQLISVEITDKLKTCFNEQTGVVFGLRYFADVVYFAFEEFLGKLHVDEWATQIRQLPILKLTMRIIREN
jgi:hypothetical protein